MKKPENFAEQLDNDSWAISFFNCRWNDLELFGSMTQEYLLLFAYKESGRHGKDPRKVIDLLLPYTAKPNGTTIPELQKSQWDLDGH
jgi:hypothetical protein